MAHQSFARTVFDNVMRLADTSAGEVTVTDLAEALLIQTSTAHKRMLNALYDLKKAGKLSRPRTGVYAVARAEQTSAMDLRAVMWRVLRMRKAVTIDDLVEMAGSSAAYAREWLKMLGKRGIVQRSPRPGNQQHLWRLVKDTVEMPDNMDKAAALRELRRKKRQHVIAAINDISDAVVRARMALKDMEDKP